MIACITGASSGIGREFAIKLSKMGYKLILVARNEQALNELAKSLPTKCKVMSCDLIDEQSCLDLADKLKKYNLSILINNAGFGDIGRFYETSLAVDLDMIDVNIKATHILTKELLPGFVTRNRGYILNVASSAGLLPGGPYMATYYATKAYVTSFTSAISRELKEAGSNVHICALCPGPVDTNFNNVAGVEFSLKSISAKYCANYALKEMFNRKTLIVPAAPIKLAVFASRFLPRKAVVAITGHQQKSKMHI